VKRALDLSQDVFYMAPQIDSRVKMMPFGALALPLLLQWLGDDASRDHIRVLALSFEFCEAIARYDSLELIALMNFRKLRKVFSY
jgi:hypothetical protein